MDISIPSHKLKTFSSSVSTLGKIGKDLYLSFDPMEGLTLSTLNDAKSAFCKFHFDSSFFERCSSCSNGNGGVSTNGGGGGGSYDTRYVCRVPLRSFHSILRPNRKGVLSLRIQSEGVDRESGVYFGLNKKKSSNANGGAAAAGGASGAGGAGGRRRGRRGHEYQRRRGRGNHNDNHDDDSDADDGSDDNDDDGSNSKSNSNSNSNSSDDEKNRSNSHSAKDGQSRKRKNKINNAQTTPSDNTTTNDNNNSMSNNNNNNMSNNSNSNQDKMMLSFEFFIELRPPSSSKQHAPSNNNASDQRRGAFRSLHKLAVTTTRGITLSASPRQRSTRSEIISHPKLWLRLLDPLRRTAEVALTIDDGLRVVTATTFHPGEMVGGNIGGIIGGGGGGIIGGGREQETTSATATAAGGGNSSNNNNNGNGKREENAILLAAAARNAMLKTETSTGCDEFDEYDFRNNRGKKRRRRNHRGGGSGGGDGSDGDDNDNGDGIDDDGSDTREFDFEREGDQPPMDVNQKVILVFSIKEAKAMLHFCSQTNNSAYHDDGDALSILSFHWGGRPIVIETDGDSYSAELVLATLHHAMIASDMTVGGSGGGNGNRRISGDGD